MKDLLILKTKIYLEDFSEPKSIQVDPQIFSYPFHCACKGDCCVKGADLDAKQREKLLALKDEIKPLMDETQDKDESQWFESGLKRDADFASGYAASTQVIHNKCAFLDKKNFCILQTLSDRKGLHKWQLKPFYCWLYPLTLLDGVLTIDEKHMKSIASCNSALSRGATTSIYDACKEEIMYLLGEEAFAELEKFR